MGPSDHRPGAVASRGRPQAPARIAVLLALAAAAAWLLGRDLGRNHSPPAGADPTELRLRAAEREVRGLQEELAALRENVERLQADPRLAEVAARVVELDAGQGRLEEALAKQDQRIEEVGAEAQAIRTTLESTRSEQEGIVRQVAGVRTSLEAQGEALAQRRAAEAEREETERRRLRDEVLNPVFQLSGQEAVGSAVLIHRDRDQAGLHYLALTSYHVVRDILAERDEVAAPYQEELDAVFEREEETLRLHARLQAEDVPNDLALLRLDTERDLGPVARLAPLSRMPEIQSFKPVITVGCPLGTAAQATRGEITRRNWQLGGQRFWMVSSPAYFGNSGGGVFLEETHELVAIFAKIYTHGSFRPQVVTHMGLAVPLEVLHQWLGGAGYARLLPAEADPALAGRLAVAEASHAGPVLAAAPESAKHQQ